MAAAAATSEWAAARRTTGRARHDASGLAVRQASQDRTLVARHGQLYGVNVRQAGERDRSLPSVRPSVYWYIAI